MSKAVVKRTKSLAPVVRCQCSVCHQVAHVVAGSKHYYCNGIKVQGKAMTTHLYNSIKHPDDSRKGTWEPV